MAISDFLYRQKQKWKYHTAANDIERQLAEINRNQEEVKLQGKHFKVKGCDLNFNRETHYFIIERIDLFKFLFRAPHTKFSLHNEDLYYQMDELSLKVTTAEELFIIREIFFENCYNVLLPEEEFVVLDIGMNVGYASLFFANNPKVKKIFAFEPFTYTYEEGLCNFKMNRKIADKIIAYNFGLGLNEEKLTVPFSKKYKGKNSILGMVTEQTEAIQIKSAYKVLDEIINADTNSKYFIKVDCEGAEFEIFHDLGMNKIPDQVLGFIIEWHNEDPLPIIDVLLKNSFKVQKNGWNKIGLIIAFR